MFRYIVIACVAAAAIVIAFSFHQPPMRLMPAPMVFLDGRAESLAASRPQALDPMITLFYATNRLAVGPTADRIYAVVPGRYLHLGVATMRIGEDASALDRIHEWSTQASAERRPFLHLQNLKENATLEGSGSPSPDVLAWLHQVDEALLASRNKDVIVYVHGANTTFERAAGQAAQIRHFTGRESVVVLFAWPTAENFLLYPRDMLTAFGAAPHLAKLVELLSTHTSARNVDVFTYSAGATVGSEGLALIGRNMDLPNSAKLHLGEVYHAAPDADFRSFVDDLRGYAGKASRVTVAANLNDSALRLSQMINRASRAGRPDIAELTPEATSWLLDASRSSGLEVLRVRPEDIPGLAKRSHTFWYDDPWISSDVLITLLFHLSPKDRGLVQSPMQSGAHYWVFPPDYPERLPEVVQHLRR